MIDYGISQLDLSGLGIIKPRLEGVAEGHQFIDFGNDAVLFGYRGESQNMSTKLSYRNEWLDPTCRLFLHHDSGKFKDNF